MAVSDDINTHCPRVGRVSWALVFVFMPAFVFVKCTNTKQKTHYREAAKKKHTSDNHKGTSNQLDESTDNQRTTRQAISPIIGRRGREENLFRMEDFMKLQNQYLLSKGRGIPFVGELAFSMEEFWKLQKEYRRRKGRDIPCVGELASQMSYVSSSQGFKIPPNAFDIVRIRVADKMSWESVLIECGFELIGLLPPIQLVQVIYGYIYLKVHNRSYVSREIEVDTIICRVKLIGELYNVVRPRKEQSRMSILVPPRYNLLKRLSINLRETGRTKDGCRIYC